MEEQVSSSEAFATQRSKQYHDFLTTFKLTGTKPHYIQLINDAVASSSYFIPINLSHVYSFSENLYWDTIKYPDEMIPVIGECVCDVAVEECRLSEKSDDFDRIKDEINDQMRVCSIFSLIFPFFFDNRFRLLWPTSAEKIWKRWEVSNQAVWIY